MPLGLHLENPHYLELRGNPSVLVGSGEHYGALMNVDFDYAVYLRALEHSGLNLTRLFAGTYREVAASFKIKHNTLAPKPGRFLAPWPPSGDGGTFDLSRFDPAYFARLKDILTQADRRGIVVELVLFCYFYNEELWRASPMWAGNNVQRKGGFGPNDAYRARDNELLEVERELTRRIVRELNSFDNLYYEIINEPYISFDGDAFLDWQALIAATIVEEEARLPKRHLIARNVSSRTYRLEDVDPDVSILNFHYMRTSAVHHNYHWNRPIADDETGFVGQLDAPYRREAWRNLLAGAAIVSNLDYSFTVDHPDGTDPDLGDTPGGGGPTLRRHLRVLKQFLESFDLVRLHPHPEVILSATLSERAEGDIEVLGDPGRAYAAYLDGGRQATLTLGLPRGDYRADWVGTGDGSILKTERLATAPTIPKRPTLVSPEFEEDIALRIVREPLA